MPEEHRVAGHLGVAADEYDRAIRTFIPGYDEMIDTIVRWLDGHVPTDGLVVDMGAGTGALSAAILDALPDVRVELLDIDPQMLEVAAARCADHAGRVRIRTGRFTDPLPRCHAVVASLALHHIGDRPQKQGVYRAVHAALMPDGLLMIGDAVVHPGGRERRRVFDEWAAGMQARGVDADAAERHFAAWAVEDHYLPLSTELALLTEAGFATPDCVWKLGAIAVYGAFRAR